MSPFHFILKCQYYYMLDISLLAILKFMIKFCMSVLKYSEKSRVSVLVSVVTCVKGQSLYVCFRGYVCEGSYLRRSKGVDAVLHLVDSKHQTQVLRLGMKHLYLLSRLTGLRA